MKKFLYLFLIFLLFLQGNQSFCDDTQNQIRVGISSQDFKNYLYNNVKISASSDFSVKDTFSALTIGEFNANTILNFKIENNFIKIFQNGHSISSELIGPILIKPKNSNGVVYVQDLKRKGKPALYKGSFEIIKSKTNKNKFLVVNLLDLQNYLKGVVPNEMPVKFGLEALKAQSIAARNYALKPRPNRAYTEFDICDSTACQVYYGANTQDELSDKAVDMTNGIVGIYKDDLIMALYHSTSGGVTENYENVFSINVEKKKENLSLLYEMYQQAVKPLTEILFPSRPIEYLKSVPDVSTIPSLKNEEDARVFILNPPQTFENQSPFYRWKVEWTKEELEKILANNLEKNKNNGFISKKYPNINEFGTLKSIKAIKRGLSSKIIELEIETDKNIYIVKKELVIRRMFLKDNRPLRSANVIFDFKYDQTTNELLTILANGAGYGHGVGMSQFGAGYLSQTGYSYTDILQHYYNGISIGTIPQTISSEINKDTYKQRFYSEDKNGILVIKNKPFQELELIIVINKNEFNAQIDAQSKEILHQDISKYLVKGKNEITVIIPADNLKPKEIKIWVELKPSQNETKKQKEQK